jgi:nitroreductase
MNIEEFNTLIKTRRSVFQNEYSGARVDDAIVKQMLENANWAPNHKLTEPWRFIVYTGTSLNELANLQAEYYKKFTAADNSFKEERYLNLLNKPKLSSHIIVIGMSRDEKKSVPEIEEVGAVFCAVQNMYLTASAYGVGCYLSTGGITYFESAQQIFGWNENVKLIGFMHIGIPKEVRQTAHRKPVTDKTVWKG